METRQQRLIRQALERSRDAQQGNTPEAGAQAAAPENTSLRKKSLKRTDPGYLPRTLTAHEWEDYYREHGVPSEHLAATDRAKGSKDAAVDTPVKKPGDLTGNRRG